MGSKGRVLKKYVTRNGKCPYDQWFDGLRSARTQAIIAVRLNRIIQGNFGKCRVLGDGVREFKIDFGPGYRIYFAEEGDTVVLLLCGGDKSSQDRDIGKAKDYWKDHRS